MLAVYLLDNGPLKVLEITRQVSITHCVSRIVTSIPLRRTTLIEDFIATYGYARQYSGVNLGSFVKHITSSNLTAEGLKNVGTAVMQLAKVEELEAHRRAVSIRIDQMAKA